MMKQRIAKYLRNALRKERRNLVEQSLIAPYSAYRKLSDIVSKSDNRAICKLYLQSKNLKRNIFGGKYTFMAVDQLVVWTTEWIKSFPTSYDCIVGIPRSGLLVANIIAQKLGKPLTTPQLFCQNQYWVSKKMDKKGGYKNILLVDDSTDSGETMEKTLQLLRSHHGNLNITRAALVATKESKHLVDLYYKIIPQPRAFEWNLLHSKNGKLASDLDGVICENCPASIDLDEVLYTTWIKNAKPHLIPAFEIDVILSNRLEKYRSDTAEWLAKHGVRYKELILWNIQSKQERNGKHAQRKIEILLKIKPGMFWESSFSEAKQIREATKIPTLCIDEMILFS